MKLWPFGRTRQQLSPAQALAQWDGVYRWTGDTGVSGGQVGYRGLHFGNAAGLIAPDSLLDDLAGLTNARISRKDALKATVVLRARNLIAGVPATMPLELRDKERKLDERNWLGDQPNPALETSVQFAFTFEDLLFEGTSYWRITRLGSDGFPLEAEHLDHRSVTASIGAAVPSRVISEDHPFEPDANVLVDGRLAPLSRPGRVRVGSIIRFTSPNPPLLTHTAKAIRVLLLLDAIAADYAQDPLPYGYFKDATDEEPLDDEEINEILSRWESARRKRRWGYIAPGLDLHSLEWPSPQQLQLTEARNHAVLEIARATGLDPENAGVAIEGSSRTYANAEQRRLDLIDFTLMPYLKAVEDRLSMGDITPRGLRAHFQVNAFTRADFKTRMEGEKIAIDAGIAVPNEARRRLGWPDVEGGDKSKQQQAPPPNPLMNQPPVNGDRNGDRSDNGNATLPSSLNGNGREPVGSINGNGQR